MLALQIYEAPLSKWKSLKNRRLQNWGMLEFFFVFSLPFSQLPPPPCKLHTEAVVEEKVHRVSPIDSIPPYYPWSLVLTGGVVHEKGLLPQDCKWK